MILAGSTLPELDAVFEAVSALPDTRHIPILLLVSPDDVTDRVVGVADYLTMPAHPREIRARVASLAELSRLRDAAYRSRNEIMSLIGHELRNPLSALQTTLQVLAIRDPSQETALMQRSVQRLTILIDNLLEMSRLARGMIKLQRRSVELAHVVDRAIEINGALLGARKIAVSIPRVGVRLDGDPERLARALAGVIANAAEHSEPATSIEIETEQAGDGVRLRIRDRGIGIAPERLATIFESLRAPTSGRLVLGLALARGIVELHGGSIRVHSEGVGQGTEVRVDLPTTARAFTKPEPEHRSGRKRLLLIEDDDDTARALKAALEQLGYSVALAHNGPVALAVVKTFDPDVALVDLGLPIMDGWEVVKRLRDTHHGLRFVAVTAYDKEAEIARSMELGFEDHLVKPIDIERLEGVVESLPAKPRS
ncbi:MAG TPA: response regulator [Kofleriaceae bacterium]